MTPQELEEALYHAVLKVLEENDGLCMDNGKERKKLALAVHHAVTGLIFP